MILNTKITLCFQHSLERELETKTPVLAFSATITISYKLFTLVWSLVIISFQLHELIATEHCLLCIPISSSCGRTPTAPPAAVFRSVTFGSIGLGVSVSCTGW